LKEGQRSLTKLQETFDLIHCGVMAASSDGDLCVWVFRILIICMVPVLYGPLLGTPLIQPMPDNSTTEATDFRDAWLPDFMGLEGKLAMHRHIKSEIKKRNFEALRLKDG
jgi:hypothetical protein